MDEMYLVIQTGHEGIEKLCFLTDDPEVAIKERGEFIKKEKQDLQKLAKEDTFQDDETDYWTKKIESVGDFFCIQKWNGQEFNCVCNQLGVKISQPMFR